MSQLFASFKLRNVEFKNRIFVSPMCQYSSDNGRPTAWHLVHLGSRAVGGAGLVMVEASAVSPEGRISPEDSGIWSTDHAAAFLPITKFLREQGAIPAMQLAHAGRKGSTEAPWKGNGPVRDQRAWTTVAPSAIPFDEGWPAPREMSGNDMEKVASDFVKAAGFAKDEGFDVIEIHAAHGYLLHQFLSPLSNQRRDEFGGSLENRMRFPLRIAREVRAAWPETLPLFVRVSATDWTEGGVDIESTIVFAKELAKLGVDLVDCSSGGSTPHPKIPLSPGYQVQFSEAVRKSTGLATGAVGLITAPEHAEAIVAHGHADVVFLARELLRDPYWPLHAAKALRFEIKWPVQYDRARPK